MTIWDFFNAHWFLALLALMFVCAVLRGISGDIAFVLAMREARKSGEV